MSPRTEETSLITIKYQSLPDQGTDNAETKCRPWIPPWFKEEFGRVLNLSWSLFLIALFQYILEPIALYFCGRLGPNEIAAVGLSVSLMNIVGLAVGLGLATACDTVFSQSFGSENRTEAGVYLIKSTIIILLFVFPCVAIHINMEQILLAIGQPECVARLTGEFMQYFAIGTPAIFVHEILMQYLRCQDYLAAPLIIGALSVVVCIAAHYVLVTVLEYGVIGSGISMTITFYFSAIVLTVYILVMGVYKDSWRGWTSDIFQGWGAFLKLAIAGFVMLAVEWWIWEISVVASGWVGPVELGAASIVLQVLSLDFQLPVGIGLAVNVRTGQLLGGKDPITAKRMIYLGAFICTVQALVVNGLVIILRYEIPHIFTDDREVIEISANILPIGCLIALIDGQCGMLVGVLRGCGKQLSASLVMVFGLTAVGLPTALVLQFYVQLGLRGFYYGLAIGVIAEFILICVAVYRIDWDRMVYDAQVRAGVVKSTYETFTESGTQPVKPIRPALSRSRLSLKFEEPPPDLTVRQMTIRRPLLILGMALFLVLGLVWRLDTEESMYAYDPCSSDEGPANVTMASIVTTLIS